MINVELYINNQLCDIVSPYELGVRFQREILIPSEITTKDVQYSFTIKLPTSATNNNIFNFANVEEVKNKFNYEYNAILIVDSVTVFTGKFKITEIDEDTYKGNLYIPATKTIKEIFNGKKMTENGNWYIPFTDITSSFDKYNLPSNTIQPCIFPLVLYGLLPKVSKNPNAVVNGEIVGEYSPKDVFDEYVRLGIEDFPPSINVLQMLQKIFLNNGYTLGGTAFEDTRLTNLYMSYMNDSDYVQEWNWGKLSKFNIKGKWNAIENIDDYRLFERCINRNETDKGVYYTCNLLESNRITNVTYTDSGSNINSFYVPNDDTNYDKYKYDIIIPQSGLYKVKLNATVRLEDRRQGFSDNGNNFIACGSRSSWSENYLYNKRVEVVVLRDYGEGDFRLDNTTICSLYCNPNENQNILFDSKNSNNYPKYFPKQYCMQMVDASTNSNLINGLAFGRPNFEVDKRKLITPRYNDHSHPLVIKNGWSWNNSFSQKKKIYSAYNNTTAYDAWNIVSYELGDEEEDTPENMNVDWVDSTKYYTVLKNAPSSYINSDNRLYGDGQVCSIIYLEKGERLTVASISDAGDERTTKSHTDTNWGMNIHYIDFELDVELFRSDREWIKINEKGKGIEEMDWNDISNVSKDTIDLIKFLPAEIKTDEWIENFCKAFNLKLSQNGLKNFDLDVKQVNQLNTTSIISLENKANINFRNNTPLGLPSVFELGFSINKEEEGFCRTNDDGGGKFETGTVDGKVLSQTSNFSYNWFKTIRRETKKMRPITQRPPAYDRYEYDIELPIISNNEVWVDDLPYSEGLSKWYVDYAQRFWYYKGTLEEGLEPFKIGENKIKVANVSNTFNQDKILNLDYKNKSNSILTTYFTVVASNDTNYTEIECYLTPDEYDRLDGSSLVKWNGDLYYISSIEGYDITDKNKTKLKLIRKMN